MEESLSQKTLKNSLWQVFNIFWVTVLNFFVTPLLLHKIGIENYGVYILILTIISFLSLLDLGVGAAFANSFIEYIVGKEVEKRNRLLNSFVLIRTGIGLIGLVLLVGLSFLADSIFGIRGEFLRQTQYGFWIGGLYFVVLMASSPFMSTAISIQRFDILGKAAFIQNTILNFLLIAFAFLRPSLTWLLSSHLIAGLANFMICFLMVKKAMPEIRVKFEFSSQELFRKMKFGLFNFVSGLANNFLMQVDRFFISQMLGNSFLAFYTISNSLAQKVYSVSGSSAATLYPVATDLFYQKERQKFGQSFRRALRIAITFSVLSGVVLMIFGERLMRFWVGQEIADKGAPLLYFFVPTYILFSIYEVLSGFYFGLGKSKTLAVFSCFMALVNIVFLVFLIPLYGLLGAALAFLLALLPVIFLIFIFEKKELDFTDSLRFYAGIFLKLLLVSAILVVMAKYFLLVLAVGLWQCLLLILFGFAIAISLFWLLGFVEEEDSELIKSFLKKIK